LLVLASYGWTQESAVVVYEPDRPYSLSEYKAALDSWITFYETDKTVACCLAPDNGMPRRITVKDGSSEFRVPLPELHPFTVDDDMTVEKAGKLNREHILERLRSLRANVEAYEAPATTASSTEARTKALEVLASSEYRHVRLPGIKESFRDRAIKWIVEKLSSIFNRSPDFNFISRLFVWSIIGLAVVVAAVFIWKFLQREENDLRWQLGSAPAPVSAKAWTVWLQEARLAASQGDWRQATRLAYWSAISALESRGTWKPDVARTPREYLSLVRPEQPHRRTLLTLTRDFERIWYAQQPATQADFDKTLAHLEELGCR
jgi:hypothetical protein